MMHKTNGWRAKIIFQSEVILQTLVEAGDSSRPETENIKNYVLKASVTETAKDL
jgi:hypothetical protein